VSELARKDTSILISTASTIYFIKNIYMQLVLFGFFLCFAHSGIMGIFLYIMRF
jgi:hypothetical protein